MSKPAKTLGGFVCVRNGIDLDYSWQLAAESLLKVVDELVLCDSDSTDGTHEAMQRMADKEPRIKIINWPWPSPKGESHHWFIEWLNFARSHLTTDFCLYLDADEVLSDAPECHEAIREAVAKKKCLTVDRLNFWRDAESLIPDGHCCGKWCTRFGPTKYECVSDEPHHAGEREVVDKAVKEPRVQIFHLGFLREKKAFYRKARVVLEGWFNRFDPRLELGEKEDKPLWETECEFGNLLVPFSGYMPDAVQLWLSERGHHTENYLARIKPTEEPKIELAVSQPQGKAMRVLHSGDFGDLIYGMPTFKAIGEVDLMLVDRGITKPLIRRMGAIVPLLEAQPYIRSVQVYDGSPIDWNASDFRTMFNRTQSLGITHLVHYRGQKHLPEVSVDFAQPWLDCAASAESSGRVVIARTSRYQNHYFQWRSVVEHYGKRILFVGTQDEHAAFTGYCGEVEYRHTATLLEVAKLIKGSDLFIGNQSSPYSIAEGLKHQRILEVCEFQPDCIYANSHNAQYAADGEMVLPNVAGSGERRVASPIKSFEGMNTTIVPPGMWQYPGFGSQTHFAALQRMIVQNQGCSPAEAAELIQQHNAKRLPNYFISQEREQALRYVRPAIENAKLTP